MYMFFYSDIMALTPLSFQLTDRVKSFPTATRLKEC